MRPVQIEEFVATLRPLVEAESPSSDVDAVAQCAGVLARLGTEITGNAPQTVPCAGGPEAVRWRSGPATASGRVLLLGHCDTVWPRGTVGQRPFTVSQDVARGPGVFDMKAGLLVGLYALARLAPDVPATLLVTGDEEIGSPTSWSLIEEEARAAQAVLVLEGAAGGGALKHARKGWSIYTLRLRGRAAHAGLEPEAGRNALVRLAGLVTDLTRLNAPDAGVTVTPTLARAGETVNTVPDRAEVTVDARTPSADAQQRLHSEIGGLAGTHDGVRVLVEGGINRPPMERDTATPLLARVADVAAVAGQEAPTSTAVGGISDANITAALGVPTLDGLGAVGGGPHAEHEWVDLAATAARSELLAALVTDLANRPLGPTGPEPTSER